MCSVCLPAPSRARRAHGCWCTCAPCGACAVVAQSKAARGHMARGAPLQRCVLCVGPAARRLRDDSSVEPLASQRSLELQTSEQVPAVCHLSQNMQHKNKRAALRATSSTNESRSTYLKHKRSAEDEAFRRLRRANDDDICTNKFLGLP